MSDLDERLATLSPEKRALFEKLMRHNAPSEDVFPISVMQQGIWFLEQLRPHNPAYHIPVAVHVRGSLNVALLRSAVNQVMRRHEILRTRFVLRDGKPCQVVAADLTLDINELDLRGRRRGGDGDFHANGWELDPDLEREISAVLAEPFDITTGPLLRLALLRLASDECVLAMAMHHLISDGWSVGILVSELLANYSAGLLADPGEPAGTGTPALPDLPIQYGDFAVWQQESMRSDSLSTDLAYWREHLRSAPAVLELPTDRPRPAVQGFNGASIAFDLPRARLQALAAVGKRHGATTYMALLAVFAILLQRYANTDDVVVGVPTANRTRTDVEPLIGFFVNTLPVRIGLHDDPDFGELLVRVRDACLGAYAHQGVPFEKIVEELRPARDLSRPPIFQTSVSYQSDPLPDLTIAGVRLRRLPLRATGARFDLELQFFDNDGGLSGWFEYDSDLFDESTMRRMAGHFRRLIDLVTAQPATPVHHLELLDDRERHRLCVELNDTARQWPGVGWIHQCFEKQVRTTPHAPALRFETRTLTYEQLNARANQLARRLRALGVGRDVLVGVGLPRCLELVVSLLAVLKAGGAYLPLDPDYPAGRLAFMVDDARVPVLLTRRGALNPASHGGAHVLYVEEMAAELAAESPDDLDVDVDGEDLAYVIYTSGSTGQPKGVGNVHAGIRNRLLWMQDEYGLDASDRVLQKTPCSFDVSVWEFFWPLMSGAMLVLARPHGHKDASYLLELIRTEAITTLHFVPSMLQLFLREDGVESATSLRRVICSGEALPHALQQRFFQRCQAQLHNLYGPTEAAIDVTAWRCRRDDDGRGVPIGRPIANTQMYVLDRLGRPVPQGVVGELYIGGRNLARGYLNRAELTQQRFVADPFSAVPGARLYRTGDLARVREDGAIDFLGRCDHQIKLRGLRIELGEIEAALSDHDGVSEAVVLAHEYSPTDVRLVAYVRGEAVPDSGELIGYLKQRLPDYMVPAAFVVLNEFPLTPNGKVDRDALPAPQLDRPELATAFLGARNDDERRISAVWCELLGLPRVGVHDNFFDLGGHSLLMPELRNRVQAATGREVSMVELFQYPTIAALAGHFKDSGDGVDNLRLAQERAHNRRQLRDQRLQTAARRTGSRTAGTGGSDE